MAARCRRSSTSAATLDSNDSMMLMTTLLTSWCSDVAPVNYYYYYYFQLLRGVSIACCAEPCISYGPVVRMSVHLSVTRWHWVKTTQARITKSSPTDAPRTSFGAVKSSSIAEKMRISEPTTKISMKIDTYCQRQKCSSMTLLSGDIRFMWIFAGVPWGGASNDSVVVEYGNVRRFRWLLLRKL